MAAAAWVYENEWQETDDEPVARSPRGSAAARRVFFWRRMLVLALLAGFGACAWQASHLFFPASGHLAGSARAGSAPAEAGGPYAPMDLAAVQRHLGSAEASAVPAARRGIVAAEGTSAREAPSPTSYVARPGDTVWSIAVRYSKGDDPRALAGTLESQIGGGVLQPGEVLALP